MRTATFLILLLVLTACADPAAVGMQSDVADTEIPETPTAPATADATETDLGDATTTGPAGSPLPTGPIPVEPDGGIGDGSGPPEQPATAPPFGVSSETDSTTAEPYTYCWTDNQEAGLCADGAPTWRADLQADAQLVVTYPEGTLTASSSAPLPDEGAGAEVPEQSPLPVEQENPGIWLVDVSGLPVGEHAVWLSWNGTAGDSHTVLSVTIQR